MYVIFHTLLFLCVSLMISYSSTNTTTICLLHKLALYSFRAQYQHYLITLELRMHSFPFKGEADGFKW